MRAREQESHVASSDAGASIYQTRLRARERERERERGKGKREKGRET